MAGLPTYHGRVLSPQFLGEVDLVGMGRLLALEPDDESNCLAVLQLLPIFGRSEVYQLPTSGSRGEAEAMPAHMRGRPLFGPRVTYDKLAQHMAQGAAIKTTPLTNEFDYRAFLEYYGGAAIPLFVISPGGLLSVVTADAKATPRTGDRIVSLVTGSQPSA
jgi:hypothetical protein